MDPVVWASDPWGRSVPIHIAQYLITLALVAGLAFAAVHAIYVRYWAKPKEFAPGPDPEGAASSVPEKVPRHSLAARSFHWIMAAAMLVLLVTGFVPRSGLRFPWVTYHWIAGTVLTASILFHIVHASLWLDFRSIWPDRVDLADGVRRVRRSLGRAAPAPRKAGKYPLENKLYHLALIAAGLPVVGTGGVMMFRVRTLFFPRNPYILGDETWGVIYVLHGLAGVGLISLTLVHIYFGLRPEKRPITKSMILGWMSRDFYLEEHDTRRWVVDGASASARPRGSIGKGDGEGDSGALRHH